MTARLACLLTLAAVLAVGATPARAQEDDYLSSEEIEKVRETQEPNKRVALFLEFARERLLVFVRALPPAPDKESDRSGELKDLLNNFIRAVDDASGALEDSLGRGGVDLGKTRASLPKITDEFLTHIDVVQKSPWGRDEDLRYDLEDAVFAIQDLQELGKKIPEGLIPPRLHTVAGQGAGKEEAAPPGKPTLKRRPEEKPK